MTPPLVPALHPCCDALLPASRSRDFPQVWGMMMSGVQVLEAGGKPGLMLFILKQEPVQTLSSPGACVGKSSALFFMVIAELMAFRLCPAPSRGGEELGLNANATEIDAT